MNSKKNRTRCAFIGGYVTQRQREQMRALATLRGVSINALLCELIDQAAADAARPQPMHNRAGIVLTDPSAVAA